MNSGIIIALIASQAVILSHHLVTATNNAGFQTEMVGDWPSNIAGDIQAERVKRLVMSPSLDSLQPTKSHIANSDVVFHSQQPQHTGYEVSPQKLPVDLTLVDTGGAQHANQSQMLEEMSQPKVLDNPHTSLQRGSNSAVDSLAQLLTAIHDVPGEDEIGPGNLVPELIAAGSEYDSVPVARNTVPSVKRAGDHAPGPESKLEGDSESTEDGKQDGAIPTVHMSNDAVNGEETAVLPNRSPGLKKRFLDHQQSRPFQFLESLRSKDIISESIKPGLFENPESDPGGDTYRFSERGMGQQNRPVMNQDLPSAPNCGTSPLIQILMVVMPSAGSNKDETTPDPYSVAPFLKRLAFDQSSNANFFSKILSGLAPPCHRTNIHLSPCLRTARFVAPVPEESTEQDDEEKGGQEDSESGSQEEPQDTAKLLDLDTLLASEPRLQDVRVSAAIKSTLNELQKKVNERFMDPSNANVGDKTKPGTLPPAPLNHPPKTQPNPRPNRVRSRIIEENSTTVGEEKNPRPPPKPDPPTEPPEPPQIETQKPDIKPTGFMEKLRRLFANIVFKAVRKLLATTGGKKEMKMNDLCGPADKPLRHHQDDNLDVMAVGHDMEGRAMQEDEDDLATQPVEEVPAAGSFVRKKRSAKADQWDPSYDLLVDQRGDEGLLDPEDYDDYDEAMFGGRHAKRPRNHLGVNRKTRRCKTEAPGYMKEVTDPGDEASRPRVFMYMEPKSHDEHEDRNNLVEPSGDGERYSYAAQAGILPSARRHKGVDNSRKRQRLRHAGFFFGESEDDSEEQPEISRKDQREDVNKRSLYSKFPKTFPEKLVHSREDMRKQAIEHSKFKYTGVVRRLTDLMSNVRAAVEGGGLLRSARNRRDCAFHPRSCCTDGDCDLEDDLTEDYDDCGCPPASLFDCIACNVEPCESVKFIPLNIECLH